MYERSTSDVKENPSLAERLRTGSKIVFVLPALRMGGAEQIVRLLAREMMGRHQVLVVATFGSGPMQAICERDRIPLVVLSNKRSISKPVRWILSLIRGVVQLRRVFAEFAPDIINVHLPGPELDTLLAAHLAGADNLVVTVHNTYPMFSSRPLADRIKALRFKSSYARFSAAIAVSDEVRDWTVGHKIVRPDRMHVVQTGIDLSKIVERKERQRLRIQKGIPLGSFVFIAVAALKPKKGHSLLLEAIAQMPKKVRTGSVFLLAGEGPEREHLEAQTVALGMQKCVRFLGMRHDIAELLALSDVFVISSYYEGLSLALMEAMATGLPIVSTRVAGSTLLVKDGINGFLVPRGDATALSKMLVHCCEHADAIRRLGQAARATIAGGFDATQMARAYEAVFATIVQ